LPRGLREEIAALVENSAMITLLVTHNLDDEVRPRRPAVPVVGAPGADSTRGADFHARAARREPEIAAIKADLARPDPCKRD